MADPETPEPDGANPQGTPDPASAPLPGPPPSGPPPSDRPQETHPETHIIITGLVNSFGEHRVHDDLSLTVRRGEILGVVGGSGTGKSVLMRSIIGLQVPEAGHIAVLGHTIAGSEDTPPTANADPANAEPAVPPANPAENIDEIGAPDLRSRWGVLFQGGALFSTLTVAENIEVPLKAFYPTLAPALAREIATLKLALSGLPPDVAAKYPSELSGGMKKRAALARALALDPELLFLDEPTAGLDPIAAAAFDHLIRELADTLGLTVFLITHDLDTLHAICDRVAVLADGKVIAIGPIAELRASDHPWIQAYFNGPRGRAALGDLPGKPEPDTTTTGAIDNTGQSGA